MIKRPKFIVFSGGCYSGKTTTLEIVAEHLRSKGYTVGILSELVRTTNIVSIDDIRSKPTEYLEFQMQVTPEKIRLEVEAWAEAKYDYILEDRSIVDSLFYLVFYTDKSKYTTADWIKYNQLFELIEQHIEWTHKIYDQVLFFYPLEQMCFDKKFRPADIDTIKHLESKMIFRLQLGYGFGPIMQKINLNKMASIKDVLKLIV